MGSDNIHINILVDNKAKADLIKEHGYSYARSPVIEYYLIQARVKPSFTTLSRSDATSHLPMR